MIQSAALNVNPNVSIQEINAAPQSLSLSASTKSYLARISIIVKTLDHKCIKGKFTFRPSFISGAEGRNPVLNIKNKIEETLKNLEKCQEESEKVEMLKSTLIFIDKEDFYLPFCYKNKTGDGFSLTTYLGKIC